MNAVGDENFIWLAAAHVKVVLCCARKVPEHIFIKAMRSRWFGSMLACILNTKPVILGRRERRCGSRWSRGAARGLCVMKHSSNSRTPKLFTAEPKNTGATSPRRYALAVEGVVTPPRRARGSRAAVRQSAGDVGVEFGDAMSSNSTVEASAVCRLVAGEEREVVLIYVVYAAERIAARIWGNARAHLILSSRSTSSSRSKGSLHGRSSFVDEDHHGVLGHAAHVHQLEASVSRHPFGAVDDDDDRVHGRQRTVGILRRSPRDPECRGC